MTYSSRLKLSTDNFSPDTDLIEVFSKKAGVVGVINPRQIAPPSGTAGAIQFSDGSAFSSDVANLIWNNTTKRMGVGTNTPLATVHIKGSGSTSATSAFFIQNSAGDRILQSYDDRTTHINGLVITGENTYGNSGFSLSSGGAGLGYITQSTYGISFNSALNIGIGAFAFTRNAENLSGGHDYFVRIENTFTGNFGNYTQNQNWSDLKLNYTINNSVSTSTGVATGLLLNATETALNGMTHRLMDLQNGGVSRFTVLPNGNVGVNKNNPAYNFQVAGTANVTLTGNNNHGVIFSVLNTDSANNTFGLTVGTYSDGLGNKNLELSGSNTTGNNLMGDWTTNGWMRVINGLMSTDHDSLRLRQQQSNNIDTGIVLYNTNNTYQMQIWRDGNVSIADTSYSTSASVTSRLFVKGKGSTSATTSLLVQNSSGTQLLKVTDDGLVTGDSITATNYLRGANGRLNIYNSGNQLIITNPYVGNYFYIGPDNVCGVDNTFRVPNLNAGNLSITANSYPNGSNMTLGTFTSNNTGINTGLIISSNYVQGGAGGPNYGKQVKFYDNLTNNNVQCDLTFLYVNPTINYTATANGQIVGFDFNPVVTAVTANTKVRAFQSSYGGAYINTTTYQDSAVLQADSTTQGLLKPRMTTTQKNAISSPAAGLEVFDTTLGRPCFYSGSAWVTL